LILQWRPLQLRESETATSHVEAAAVNNHNLVRQTAISGNDFRLGTADGLVDQCFGRAELRAGWLAAAQVALDYHMVLLIVNGTAKRASRHTRHTLDALLLVDLHRARFLIAADSINQTGLGAGRVFTLQTARRCDNQYTGWGLLQSDLS
jgi:hypothetical protein